MRISRRGIVLGVAGSVWATAAHADSELDRALRALGETVDEATGFYDDVVLGIRNVTTAVLRQSIYRPRLQSAYEQLTELREARVTLVQQLRAFVAQVRRGGDGRFAWEAAIDSADNVSRIIVSCADAVADLPELSTALPPERRAALRQSFAVRATILGGLRNLPVPSSASDLAQVEQLANRYEAWSNASNALRLELRRAID